MLTEREQRFVEYWEKNREREKKTFRQLLVGLPLGLAFIIPLFLNFLSGWYKRASMWANGHEEESPVKVIFVAALLILAFIAIFSKKHRWDMHEQTYLELKSREKQASKTENGTDAA